MHVLKQAKGLEREPTDNQDPGQRPRVSEMQFIEVVKNNKRDSFIGI